MWQRSPRSCCGATGRGRDRSGWDRVDAAGPLAAVVENFWSVQWALPPGREHEQEVVTHPCSHVTVEDGLAWVQGVVVHRFSRRLSAAARSSAPGCARPG